MAQVRQRNGGLLPHSYTTSGDLTRDNIDRMIREYGDEGGPKPKVIITKDDSDSSKISVGRILSLEDRVARLEKRPGTTSTLINDLNSDKYELRDPINIILEIYDDEVLASFPDLELFGDGRNIFEAIADLKEQILDLHIDYQGTPNKMLGTDPLRWKKLLTRMIKKCKKK